MSLRPNLFALSDRLWPRMAQFADTPSLLALALLLDGARALVPAGFRIHKESLT
jgi:hypothetical protein